MLAATAAAAAAAAAQLQHQNNHNCLGLAAASGQLPQLGVAAAAVDASPVHLLHATKQTR